jgi:hypothetical protein
MRTARSRRRRLVLAAGAATTATMASLTGLVVHFSGAPAEQADVLTTLTEPITNPDVVTSEPSPGATEDPLPLVPDESAPEDPAQEQPSDLTGGCKPQQTMASCPDGKPGWWAGFNSCSVPTGPSDSGEAARIDGITVELELAAKNVQVGDTLKGILALSNDGPEPVRFTMMHPPGWRDELTAAVFGAGGGGAMHASDVFLNEIVELDPGEMLRRTVEIPTHTCGDTHTDAEPALPVGDYAAAVQLHFFDLTRTPATPAEPPASPGSSSSVTPTPTTGTATATPSPEPSPTGTPAPEPNATPTMSSVASAHPIDDSAASQASTPVASGCWIVSAAFRIT